MTHYLIALLLAGELALDYPGVVKMALSNNLTYQSARLQTDQAEARAEIAEAQRNPTVTLNGFYVHNDLNLVRSLEPDRRHIPEAEARGLDASDLYVTGQNQMLNRTVLVLPIYTGGKLESQMHRQRHLYEASQSQLEVRRQATVLEAKQQYLAWLLADRSLEVAVRSQAQANQLEADTSARFHSGAATGYDLMQGQLAVARAADRRKAAETLLEDQRLQLARLLHVPQDQSLRSLDRLGSRHLLADEPVLSEDPRQLAGQALQQRPELEQLRRSIESTLDDEGVARSGKLPQLIVNLNYDLIGNTLKLRGGVALIASLYLPIFDGGMAEARSHEARLHRLQLKHEEMAQAEEIVKQVMQASLSLEEAESRWRVAESALRRTQEALRIAQRRYEVGAGTTLELVTQTAAQERADYSLAQADFQRMQARAQLRWAVGAP
ncbi:MAG: TolC family protein [Vulcanimicrobiota bacterium]